MIRKGETEVDRLFRYSDFARENVLSIFTYKLR